MLVTYRYDAVKHTTKKRVSCRSCGKSFYRQRTFYQTINPFNKNAEGYPKSRSEIWTELKAESESWQPDDICSKCKDNA
jgi:hypothetical protein